MAAAEVTFMLSALVVRVCRLDGCVESPAVAAIRRFLARRAVDGLSLTAALAG